MNTTADAAIINFLVAELAANGGDVNVETVGDALIKFGEMNLAALKIIDDDNRRENFIRTIGAEVHGAAA